MCDTGGNERFRTLTGNYYHSAAASVCVYDVAAEETFLRLVSWMADTRKFQPNQTLFLVANKCDSSIEIDKEREQVFIEEHEINVSKKYWLWLLIFGAAPCLSMWIITLDKPSSLFIFISSPDR